jgi:hypothetical protein
MIRTSWIALFVFVLGCGGSMPTASPDAGAPEGGMIEAGEPDAARQWCSTSCGRVDGGTNGGIECSAGQICGETGGVSGFICCTPGPQSICSPGYPAPGSSCP